MVARVLATKSHWIEGEVKVKIRGTYLLLCFSASLVAAPGAQAQWAVIDVPAIGRLMQQVQTMQQALATAKSAIGCRLKRRCDR